MLSRGFFFFVIVFAMSMNSHAQLDPSSTLLLDSGTDTVDDTGLDTGRYKVRKRTEEFSKPVNINATNQENSTQNDKQKVQVEVKKVKATEKEVKTVKVVEVEKPLDTERSARPNIQVLKFEVAPFYFYSDSSSVSLFRSYNTSAPGVKAKADVWMNKNIGLYTKYAFTLGASVNGALDSSRFTRIDYQWFESGFNYRRVYSGGNQLLFKLGYFESELQVPSDETFRVGLRSSGFSLGVGFDIRNNKDETARFLQVELSPYLNHKEKPAGLSISSGDKDESHRLQLRAGKRYELDRDSGFYWALVHELEKNSFKNDSSPVDPIRATTIENAQVIQSSIFVEFGYYWGK